MDNRSQKQKITLKKAWNLITIPLSVVGLLSLSDQLVTLHDSIQNIIDSYQSLIYPVFRFVFSWFWFDVPTWVFDYLTLGILVTSSQRKAFGTLHDRRLNKWVRNTRHGQSLWVLILINVFSIIWSIIIWPYPLINSILIIRNTRPDGQMFHLSEKYSPGRPIYIKYNWKDQDILSLHYMVIAIILFILILIINYTVILRS